MAKKQTAEKKLKEIRRRTRKKYSSEEKIRIVLEGLRGSIYPNPTNNFVTVKGYNIKMIEVRTINGKIVDQIKTSNENYLIDFSNQVKGIYLIRVVTEKNVIIKKTILE